MIQKRLFFRFIILIMLLPCFLSAQFSYSGSLNSRYADSENDLGFNEHLFDFNVDYSTSDRIYQGWTQFEFSEPPELGRPVQELRKLRFEYLSGNITAKIGDIFITLTGGISAIDKRHLEIMRNGAIIANSGHFNVEINIQALEEMSISRQTIRPSVEELL